jgi:hypothetical protein
MQLAMCVNVELMQLRWDLAGGHLQQRCSYPMSGWCSWQTKQMLQVNWHVASSRRGCGTPPIPEHKRCHPVCAATLLATQHEKKHKRCHTPRCVLPLGVCLFFHLGYMGFAGCALPPLRSKLEKTWNCSGCLF